ncbi:hypothetical protein [Arcticibacter tournemirensis]
MSSLELVVHREDYISIKDYENKLDIKDRKWDKFLSPITALCSNVYFEGYRLNYFPDDYYDLLELLTEDVLLVKDGCMQLFVKVKDAYIFIGRGSLASVWDWYEYSALFFLKNSDEEKKLLDLIERKVSITQIARIVSGLYILYKGIEQNVLWLECSYDVPAFGTIYSPDWFKE